jgi:adenylyltransferase/sulfurtransferase
MMTRYVQQTSVPEISPAGQQKLRSAKVLVVGAGGLATPLTAYLAGAGVGTIGIVDGDRVDLSNLSRQFLYRDADIGQCKSNVLAEALRRQNPDITVHAFSQMLDPALAAVLFPAYDIICDCTDNAAARLLCDGQCGVLKKPLVYAVVRDWQGYVTVLHHTRGIALGRLFPEELLREADANNCTVAGIVNTTCGVGGSLQGAEVIKIILGLRSDLDGGILAFDTLKPAFRILSLQ